MWEQPEWAVIKQHIFEIEKIEGFWPGNVRTIAEILDNSKANGS